MQAKQRRMANEYGTEHNRNGHIIHKRPKVESIMRRHTTYCANCLIFYLYVSKGNKEMWHVDELAGCIVKHRTFSIWYTVEHINIKNCNYIVLSVCGCSFFLYLFFFFLRMTDDFWWSERKMASHSKCYTSYCNQSTHCLYTCG